MSDTETENQKFVKDTRIACKYGAKCYQKKTLHFQKYKHPPKKENKDNKGDPPAKRKRTDSPKTAVNKGEANKIITTDTEATNSKADSPVPVIEGYSEDEEQADETVKNSHQNSKKEEKDKNEDIKKSSSEASSSTAKNLGHTPKEFIDVNTFIEEKFLVKMPQDFYQFWDFCKSLNQQNPENALKTIDLTLVGPFDVLAGKFYDIPEKPAEEYLTHWRYYYDPPEFQTVLKGSDKTGFHIGYFRDSPDELPVFLASNHSKKDGELKIVGENIFASVNLYLEQLKRLGDPFKKMAIEMIQKKICKKAEELNLDLKEESTKVKRRARFIVTRSFNKMGIVVPYNRKTQVGYRDLGVSNKEFSSLLKRIKEALPEQRQKLFSELQNILTNVTIATDECDFGTGIELGLDILAYGIDCLNSTVLRYLSTNYRLIGRYAFSKIAEAHLKTRKKDVNLSIL